MYIYTYYSTFVWKFRTIAQHYYYWFLYPHPWITAQGPSPSHPPGAMGFACVSIFRKHFRQYDSLGNWKAPDEHNQDESTLYISDPPEGCYTLHWNQQFLDCVYTEAIIHTPKERRRGYVWRIGFSGNTNRQRKRQRYGLRTWCFDGELNKNKKLY